ncbi:MAG: hypothetical protein UX85_C0003G0113 [Candidatus Beckwithbacteria bacterium GW2011_GWB1_47_15]|uniref:Deoxynucleoside kinase domain-containing protein n=1 Tax=Candidatus Beckwithbacteria bacterium GW2011_GWB1_47_15 TaxID=1618371 RepID=A0A0G1RVU6_9BACT|nr:MAG: dgk, deoxyguanosine kinase [Candidatus Beckwithbacteria bacterium GW2011_GWC1_49_16]KKU35359.1 MAG: hypothetical protein UX50_C0004G0090 [Candidatus Beckwithbacteria bacterium GW2011_GWA1_46_30]KKU61454.1 MAG: hypothetical protein UX85_C0003G0113 [Candidatus Beckwithbacteria bacterium GW2011_GWB1_47_15]KKU71861.1 MAG: hypothetical protein UX97_C0003G0090 [Candidatus Beckwithbacteria bacterium GW2011_GWA2_47_25]KKW03756.1 MAG: hypothetical protein UY37_C0004G0049 [Candidatus Beckwithbact
MRKSGVITVIGNIASGKSTAVPILAEALGGQAVFADELFQTVDPFRDRFLVDIKRWALANELWLAVERVNLLKTHLKDAKRRWQVIDSGILMSWAFTHSHFLAGNLTEDEWRLFEVIYRRLTDDFLAGTVVVALSCPVATLRKRVVKRGRVEEERRFEIKYYQKKYLNNINKGLTALKRKLRQEKKVKLISVNEGKIMDFAATERGKKQLVRLVKKEL